MAATKVTVNKNWIDAQRFFVIIPKSLANDLKTVLDEHMQGARAALLQNVSGGILNKKTGRLADTIKHGARIRDSIVSARAGSRYFIGRFWEDGFNLRMRSGETKRMAPKKWGQPVVEAKANQISQAIEATIDATIKKGGF